MLVPVTIELPLLHVMFALRCGDLLPVADLPTDRSARFQRPVEESHHRAINFSMEHYTVELGGARADLVRRGHQRLAARRQEIQVPSVLDDVVFSALSPGFGTEPRRQPRDLR